MRKMMKAALVMAAGLFGLALLLTASMDAQARPNYLPVLKKTYPDLKELDTVKCGVCHPEKDKKVRSNYGMAVGKGLSEKNLKDEAKIVEALRSAEAAPSAIPGMTFGDLIKGGALPTKKE